MPGTIAEERWPDHPPILATPGRGAGARGQFWGSSGSSAQFLESWT